MWHVYVYCFSANKEDDKYIIVYSSVAIQILFLYKQSIDLLSDIPVSYTDESTFRNIHDNVSLNLNNIQNCVAYKGDIQ